MAIKYTNLAATTLTASAAGGDLTITVNSIAGFPSVTGGTDHFYIQVGGDSGEIMKVTESTTNTWTVVRGQDGTSAIAHSISDAVELRLPRIMIQDLFQDSDLNWVTTGNLSGADLTVGGNATIAGTLGVTGAITGPLAASNLTGTLDDAVVVASNITQHEASITHQNLSGAGVNTHAAIDSHIASAANPHGVTIAQVSPLTTDGDILIYNTTNTRLPIGTSGQVLAVSVGGVPEWINNPAGFSDPLTTRGDLMYKDPTNTTTRLPIGTVGQVLTSDGTDVSWANPTSGFSDPMTNRGDIIIRDATNTTARLGVGAAGTALTSDGTDVSWSAVGDVDGPASATDNAIARYDLTTGKLLQNSGVTIDDSNNIAGVADFGGATATLTGDLTVNSGGAAQINVGEELLEEGSTGLTSGGALSIGTPTTTYDVALGSDHIVDAGASTYTSVSWGAITGTTPGANGVRYIFINSGGTITESASAPTGADRRNLIYLGRVIVSGGVVIQAFSEPAVTRQPTNQVYDLAKALRIFNESGNTITPNGVNLSFDKSAGVLFSVGSNFHTNAKIPHSVSVASSTPTTFQHLTQTAATGTDVTVISPANYDVAGTITAIPGSNNQATNMRIYLFPSGNVRVAYGQTIYSTLTNAIQGLSGETFVENSSIAGNGVLICVLSVTKGCTDLSDTATARFLPVSRFGETSVGGAGASVSSLQNVYDNSVTPEIVVDATRGAVTIQDNATPLGANLLEVQSNGGGSTYFAVTATEAAVTGNITVTGTVDGRDVATDGSTLDNLNTTLGLGSLTAAEVTQLQNIDATTISTTQWGYLGATNQGLATTNNVTFNDVTVSGNLQVDGTTTTVNSATLDVADANITVNNGGNQASADTNDAGLTVEMSDATDAIIHYDSTAASRWKVGEVGASVEIVDLSSVQTLTNKSIDAAQLTGTIADARISASSVTQHEGSIDHDALLNFSANEHIDWTSTTASLSTTGTLSAGAGTFSSLDTGHGANELYAMNQNVRTTDSPTFAAATLTGNLTVDTDTFFVDATNNRVGIGTTTPTTRLQINTTNSNIVQVTEYTTTGPTIRLNAASNATADTRCLIDFDHGGVQQAQIYTVDSAGTGGANLIYRTYTAAGDHVFLANSSEALRIDATNGNVGIGTTSPSSPLDVDGQIVIGGTRGYSQSSTFHTMVVGDRPFGDARSIILLNPTANTTVGTNAGMSLQYNSADEEFSINDWGTSGAPARLTIERSGNVGIGTASPNTLLELSSSSQNILAINNGNVVTNESRIEFRSNTNIDAYIGQAANSGNLTISSGRSVAWGGEIVFDIDTAEAARFDSNGRLGLGTDTPQFILDVKTATDRHIGISDNAGGSTIFGSTDAGASTSLRLAGFPLIFTGNGGSGAEHMRLDSNGKVGIGTTTPGSYISGANNIVVENSTGTSGITVSANATGAAQLLFSDSTSPTTFQAGIQYFNNTDHMEFTVNSSERMRINSSGNLLLGGSTTPASAAAALVIFNGTAPTGSVTNGVVLYAEDVTASSELKVRDEAGNVTTLSPHNFSAIPEGPSEDMAWAYYSKNETVGREINVDMLKLARLVEKLSGEKIVHIKELSEY